ncbi:hypothetical protein RYX36_002648 [Vicia faba]
MIQKLLVDSQVREYMIMAYINVVALENEDMRSMMKGEVKEDILATDCRMITQTQALKTFIDYLGGNNFNFHHNSTSNVSTPDPEDIVVAPAFTFDPSDVFPTDLP